MKKLLLILLPLLLLWGCDAGKPAATPEYVLTYAENQHEDYPTTQSAHYFADLWRSAPGDGS